MAPRRRETVGRRPGVVGTTALIVCAWFVIFALVEFADHRTPTSPPGDDASQFKTPGPQDGTRFGETARPGETGVEVARDRDGRPVSPLREIAAIVEKSRRREAMRNETAARRPDGRPISPLHAAIERSKRRHEALRDEVLRNDASREASRRRGESVKTASDVATDSSPAAAGGASSPEAASAWAGYVSACEETTIHASVVVRIYNADKALLSVDELDQWVQYMRYAGVGKIYIYDNWQLEGESLEGWAKDYAESIVYHDWGQKPFGPAAYNKGGGFKTFGPFDPAYEAAFRNSLKKYGKDSTWQVAFDMDEYPVAPEDTAPGFLCRAVKTFSDAHPDASELSLKNFAVIGPNDKSVPWIMERYTRKTEKPLNQLDKPIYRVADVGGWSVHHNKMKKGQSLDVPVKTLHQSHFWGARTFGWGDSIPDALMDKTYDYHDLARLASAVRGWTAVRRRRLGERATLVPKKDERLLRGPAPPRKNLRRHPINKSN